MIFNHIMNAQSRQLSESKRIDLSIERVRLFTCIQKQIPFTQIIRTTVNILSYWRKHQRHMQQQCKVQPDNKQSTQLPKSSAKYNKLYKQFEEEHLKKDNTVKDEKKEQQNKIAENFSISLSNPQPAPSDPNPPKQTNKQDKKQAKQRKKGPKKYGNVESEQQQSSSSESSSIYQGSASQQKEGVTKQDSINYDKRRRRDRDQMILAYKIEYLLFLMNGKRIIRKEIRAKPLVGPRQSRKEEWDEAMEIYRKLVRTLEQQIKCKSIILAKICRLGKQNRGTGKEGEDSLTGQKNMFQSQNSIDSFSSVDEEEEQQLIDSLKKSLKEFEALQGKGMKHEYSVCLQRLKEIIKLKGEIEQNLDYVRRRPSNNLKGRRRRKSKPSKTVKKVHYFDLSQPVSHKSKSAKNQDNKSSSLISSQMQPQSKPNANRISSLRPRKAKHQQSFSNQSKQVHMPQSVPNNASKSQANLKVQPKQIAVTALISPPTRQPARVQNNSQRQNKLKFQNNLISQSIIFHTTKQQSTVSPPSTQPLKLEPQNIEKTHVSKEEMACKPKKKQKKSESSQSQPDLGAYKQFLQFKKYMKRRDSQQTPRYHKRPRRQSSSSEEGPYIRKIVRTVKRLKNAQVAQQQ